jgi:dienelactone hydrolase
MLSEIGYAVFAIDMYGKGVRPTALADKKAQTNSLYSDRVRMRTLINGGVKAAESMGAQVENSVIAGYCFGGAVVLEYARSGADLKGFASFHGGLETPDGQSYKQTKGELIIFHGTADTAVTMEDFSTLAEELEEHGVKHEMITYSGAPHAFTVFGSDRYRKEADDKSWNRFVQFLAQLLREEKK